MAKDNSPAKPVVQQAAQKDFPLSLDEFCARLSQTDRRVEMIGAFNAAEKAAGRVKDTEQAFNARYVAFINQPA